MYLWYLDFKFRFVHYQRDGEKPRLTYFWLFTRNMQLAPGGNA